MRFPGREKKTKFFKICLNVNGRIQILMPTHPCTFDLNEANKKHIFEYFSCINEQKIVKISVISFNNQQLNQAKQRQNNAFFYAFLNFS